MPEELDTATAGTEGPAPEPEPTRPGSRRTVTVVVGIAMLFAVGIVAEVVTVTSSGGDDTSSALVAKRRQERPASSPINATVDDVITSTSSNPSATTSTTLTITASETPTPVASIDESPPPAPAPAPSSVPGTPAVTISAPVGADGCTASWTVDDGGSPLVDFVVTHESAPAPPGPGGEQIGTALMMERTNATSAPVDLGGTIRVAAENSVGTGATSDALTCS